MTTAIADPFTRFKEAQRDGWSSFLPVENITIRPAAELVNFARVGEGQRVLDVGCGTGVVALTAARRSAVVAGLDLTPVLLQRARENAKIAGIDAKFIEGDAEALPYPDGSFDVVLSQFGHMFAPRPEVATREMLRVLKSGGTIAFSTWPPEHFFGWMFGFIARNMPRPPAGAQTPAPPALWGDPNVVRERMGAAVTNLKFGRGTLIAPALSIGHFRMLQEKNIGPLSKLVAALQSDPARLVKLRAEFEAAAGDVYADNAIHGSFLMTRAVKI